MVSVLPVSASACFILRAVFGVLFIMASAFFRMLGHNRFPSVIQLERHPFLYSLLPRYGFSSGSFLRLCKSALISPPKISSVPVR